LFEYKLPQPEFLSSAPRLDAVSVGLLQGSRFKTWLGLKIHPSFY
jgi:hypothetical protein